MKFSLKDLMWSVTLASLGLGVLALYSNLAWHGLQGEPNLLFVFSLLFLPGAFFGGAIGKLFQRTTRGVFLGLLVEFFLLIAWSAWMAQLS